MRLPTLFVCCLIAALTGLGQSPNPSKTDSLIIPASYKPEFRRERNHDLIDQEQAKLLVSDGQSDGYFDPLRDAASRDLLTRAFTRQIDWIQYRIETDTTLEHRLKMSQLFGLEYLIRQYRLQWALPGGIAPAEGLALIQAYTRLLEIDKRNGSIRPAFFPLSYEGGMAILGTDLFQQKPGYAATLNDLVLKYCTANPNRILPKLQQYPDVISADSLLAELARKRPRLLYDYAAAGDRLGARIRNHSDSYVQVIATMAGSKNGQQYFPFLDQLIHGRLSFRDIDEVREDTIGYYQLLVRTQREYWSRAIEGDTAFEYAALTQRLEKKALEDFVHLINGLHNEPAEIRFARLQKLSAAELYYLAVSSDGSIYTSSFVRGIYPLLMQRIGQRGDSLLMQVRFDRYRKFIKMAAGYNTLGDFLRSFPPATDSTQLTDAEVLMKAFVGRLERSPGLEEGVDVADSYASILEHLKPLADQMLTQIGNNLQRNQTSGDRRGQVIYRILQTLFRSADSTQKVDLTRELGIPPVYQVPYQRLVNDSGQVIIQVFFYGDVDGKNIFNGFLKMFNNPNWKLDDAHPQWVCIRSVKGKPVFIYANRPLPEDTGEDDLAQAALTEFLANKQWLPTITIHRGHSYYAPSTIERLSKN